MKVRYPLYRLGQWLSGWIPEAIAWTLAERLADDYWRRSPTDITIVQRNLTLALGRPVDATSPLVREVFRNFGRYFIEFFRGHRILPHLELQIEGRHHLAAAAAPGRGVILLSAHLGNWELLGAVIVWHLGVPLSAVALPHEDTRVDGLFNRQRARCGIEVIPLGEHAATSCLRALRRGRFLGLLGDREFGETGIPVSVFGRLARLPRGPALLSVRAQAPMVPIFMLREGVWRFRIDIEPPIWPCGHITDDSSLQELMVSYAAALERSIHRAPTQWLLFRPLRAAERLSSPAAPSLQPS